MRENETIVKAVEAGQWDRVIDYVNSEVFDKPEEILHPQQTPPGSSRGSSPDPARDIGESL